MQNLLINPGFESGIIGWIPSGSATIDATNVHQGSNRLKLGEERGGVRQRVQVDGNLVLQLDACIHSPDLSRCVLFLEFYDEKDKLLKSCSTEANPSENTATCIYTESPALTNYVIVNLDKPNSDSGVIYVDSFYLKSIDAPYHAPTHNVEQYELPLWRGSVTYDETVLLYSMDGGSATGNLLYPPIRILSVKNASLTTTYVEGVDFTRNGNTITRLPDSPLPYKKDTDFPDYPTFNYYDILTDHIVVTYTHDGEWTGPFIEYKGEHLPRTMDKLIHKQPLNIVAYGDSITRGLDVSSFHQIPPFMPIWVNLFTDILKKKYRHDNITLTNAALPGATSGWGVEEADTYVTPLHPDLVILAFGMNDFWSVDGETFKKNIQTMINKIRGETPDTEFILVSSMMFDSAYVNDGNHTSYHQNMRSYVSALQSLSTTGVQLYDMTSISEYLYTRKKAKDMISNPLHPGDYLARWYGLGLASLLDREEKTFL